MYTDKEVSYFSPYEFARYLVIVMYCIENGYSSVLTDPDERTGYHVQNDTYISNEDLETRKYLRTNDITARVLEVWSASNQNITCPIRSEYIFNLEYHPKATGFQFEKFDEDDYNGDGTGVFEKFDFTELTEEMIFQQSTVSGAEAAALEIYSVLHKSNIKVPFRVYTVNFCKFLLLHKDKLDTFAAEYMEGIV